jgi:tRNA-dihydrouridine synthase A
VWRRTLADPKIIKAEGPNLYRRAWREAFGTDF